VSDILKSLVYSFTSLFIADAAKQNIKNIKIVILHFFYNSKLRIRQPLKIEPSGRIDNQTQN